MDSSIPPMQHDEDVFTLWQDILRIATTTLDWSTVPAKITAVLGEAFQVDGCAIAWSGFVPGRPVLSCWISDTQPFSIQDVSLHCESWSNPVMEPEPVVVSRLDTNGLRTAADATQAFIDTWQTIRETERSLFQVQSLLGIVIPTRVQLNGMISLMRSRPYAWTETEIERLKTITQAVAIALSKVQLQQQLGRQSHYQAVVNQLTMAIRNSSNLDEILTLAMDGAVRALQVNRGILLRLKYWDPLVRSHPQDSCPRVRVTVASEWLNSGGDQRIQRQDAPTLLGSPAISVFQSSFWLSECSLCQHAFLNAPNILQITDRQDLSAIAPPRNFAPVLQVEQMVALLLVPLESQGAILGFLVFQHDRHHVWQPEELEFVELVSAQVSTAIIQTETLRQVQALVEQRTAELHESLLIQAKLYERTRQQVDQLRHLNQLKDDFLSTVSHELRTPLTSMTMAIRMLRQVGVSADRSSRYLDILEQQCAQETNLINDLLALQEIELKQVPIQRQQFDLNDLIRDLKLVFNQKWTAKGLTLLLELPQHPVTVHSDRDSLHRILLELLTNAAKYSEPNSTVELTLIQQNEFMPKQVILTLCNVGAGISAEELPHIFDKFWRCQGAAHNAIQGTGLGLALVKCLVQHLNGSIAAFSSPVNGSQTYETCFTLTLPQMASDF
jgi:signal transduction histidine kinase